MTQENKIISSSVAEEEAVMGNEIRPVNEGRKTWASPAGVAEFDDATPSSNPISAKRTITKSCPMRSNTMVLAEEKITVVCINKPPPQEEDEDEDENGNDWDALLEIALNHQYHGAVSRRDLPLARRSAWRTTMEIPSIATTSSSSGASPGDHHDFWRNEEKKDHNDDDVYETLDDDTDEEEKVPSAMKTVVEDFHPAQSDAGRVHNSRQPKRPSRPLRSSFN
jgi:hypothetical protein